MDNSIEVELFKMISDAGLDPGERQIVESNLLGRLINGHLVHETRVMINNLIKSRPPSYIKWSMNDMSQENQYGGSGGGGSGATGFYPDKKPVPYQLKPSGAIHSTSDANMKCPHCYSTGNQRFMGTTVIDQSERPTYHCGGCNKVYTDMPAAIKVIADAAIQAGATHVGFIPVQLEGPVTNATQQFDYTLQSNTSNMNNKLDQVNSNLSSLTYTIQNLMNQVSTLAQQNSKLMEQLATDPLIGMRKNVSEFDLK